MDLKLVEQLVLVINKGIVLTCQLLAMFVISVGIMKAVFIFIKDIGFGEESGEAIQESRAELGHAFSLGLGFLIGASILQTSIAPDWDGIGKLAAIIAIRTVLNHFLMKDIQWHKDEVQRRAAMTEEEDEFDSLAIADGEAAETA